MRVGSSRFMLRAPQYNRQIDKGGSAGAADPAPLFEARPIGSLSSREFRVGGLTKVPYRSEMGESENDVSVDTIIVSH